MIYPKLIEEINNVQVKLKNHLILEYLEKSVKSKDLINNFIYSVNILLDNAKSGQIETEIVNNLAAKLNELKELLKDEIYIKSYTVEIIDLMNYFVNKFYVRIDISVDEVEFSKRYERLISLLNTKTSESNLILHTIIEQQPFKVYKNTSGSLVVISGEEKTQMAISKNRLIEVAYGRKEPTYKSYEPVIIEKLFDNTIFDEIIEESIDQKKTKDFIEDLKNSTTEGQRLKALEEDKDKLYGQVKQLEDNLKSNHELVNNLQNLYKNASSLEEDYDNAKNAVLKELRLQKSYKFWQSQVKAYNVKFWIYMGMVVVLSLCLIFGLYFYNGWSKKTVNNVNQVDIISENNIKDKKLIVQNEDTKTKDSENSIINKVDKNLNDINLLKYGFMILCISLGIWIIRILMKIALSNYHLSIDANERVIMIRTYLALLKEGSGFSDDDKKVILDNIFRPTNHGIIKDESSVTVTDIISSLKK